MTEPTQAEAIAFLRSIGCESRASDAASIAFARKVIAGTEASIVEWLREKASIYGVDAYNGAAEAIERGDHRGKRE